MSVKSHTRTIFLMAADVLAVFAGILAALALRLGVDGAASQLDEHMGWTKIAFASTVWVVGMYFHDLYDYEVISGREEMLLRLIQSVGLSWVALLIIYSFVPSLELGRGTALYAIAITLCFLLIIRLLVQMWLGHPDFGEKILVVGSGRGVTDMVNAAQARSAAGYRIIGFLSDSSTNGAMSSVSTNGHAHSISTNGNAHEVKNLGKFDDLEYVVNNSRIDRVVVGMAERRGALPTDALLRLRLSGDVVIDECSSFYERICGKVHLDMVRPSWLIFSQHSRNTQLKTFFRDLVHRLLALVGLVLTLP
ncbi:MAG TPA: hypothetical protein VJV05_13450, partial [Pyrinomonadaceae bacterium]|nr:hypothetical protein [Pyrinomonadaceae bacterium]